MRSIISNQRGFTAVELVIIVVVIVILAALFLMIWP
ncbi:MAG: prepilin-type N-terminal cleavage/methylation domain-containing protein, partial [Planctomycetota bacterium]